VLPILIICFALSSAVSFVSLCSLDIAPEILVTNQTEISQFSLQESSILLKIVVRFHFSTTSFISASVKFSFTQFFSIVSFSLSFVPVCQAKSML
jgi:hypothetical protein